MQNWGFYSLSAKVYRQLRGKYFIVDRSLVLLVYLSEHELNEEQIVVSTIAKPRTYGVKAISIFYGNVRKNLWFVF